MPRNVAAEFTCAVILCHVAIAGAEAQTPDAAQVAAPAQVADLPLEDLLALKVATVYAASRFVQEVAQAPASVSIITGEEIRRHGYRTLADILRNVRGFYVTYDRNYSYIGVRGFARTGDYNSRILVLVNGHRLNDAIFDEALLGTESPLDVALFDRVEVVRGPNSSLYGTNAFFAVVNIITRSGQSLDGVEVEGQTGSQTLRGGRVTAGGRTEGGLQGLFSASASGAEGNRRLYYSEFDTPGENNGVVRNVDGEASQSVFGSAEVRGWRAQMGYGSRRKTIPTAAFDTIFNDPRTRTVDRRGFLDVAYTARIGDRSTLEAAAAYDHYSYDGTYPYDAGPFLDGARGAWTTTEIAYVRRFNRHRFTAGLEYRDNMRQDQFAADDTGVLLDDRRHSRTAAAYAEHEARIHPRLRLVTGLRWDRHFDTFGATLNPRVGVIVSPLGGSTVKLLYGRAFRAPTPYELYYDRSGLGVGLTPERIVTQEAVWEQRIGPRIQLTATAFQNRVSNLIAQRSAGPASLDVLYYLNAGGARATGAELELQGELPHRIRGRVSSTFQSATSTPEGSSLGNSPGRLVTAVIDAPVGPSGLMAGFNAYYVGRRDTLKDATVGATWVSDLTLSQPLAGSRIQVAVSAHNLFDAAYADPASEEHRQDVIPQDGRTLSLRVTWRF